MHIPKLAEGGIIDDNLSLENREKGGPVYLINDKYYQIYKHTKNRRIKKKQIKRSFRLVLMKEFENYKAKVGIPIVKIKINGKEFKNETSYQ